MEFSGVLKAQRTHDVNITSMQRHDVASTLRRRYIYVMCLPGGGFESATVDEH